MKPVVIGRYQLGRLGVVLIVDQSLNGGGSFNICPNESTLPEMRVSFCGEDRRSIYSVLMHEAIEFCLAIQGNRYCACAAMGNSNSADWLFVADHQMLDRAICDATEFLLDAQADLERTLKKIKAT
jgi:hypothetical protein